MGLIEKIDAEIARLREDLKSMHSAIDADRVWLQIDKVEEIKQLILSEQKEPCEYCGKMKSLYFNNDYTESEVREIYIESDGSMTISNFGGYNDINLKISHCPKCGRPLNQPSTDAT